MITSDKLKKFYEYISNNEEITTSLLNGFGFNSNDITNLVKDNIIEREKRGYYTLKIDKNDLAIKLGIKKQSVSSGYEITEDLKMLIDSNVIKLNESNPMILLEPMSRIKHIQISNYVKKIKGVYIQKIYYDGKVQLILKKKYFYDRNLNVGAFNY